MKAIEYLKREREIKKHCADVTWGYYDKDIDEAIKEIESLAESNRELLEGLISSQKDWRSGWKNATNNNKRR